MTYAADERVDAYIAALPDWQQAICRQVRDLVHAADPEVSETIKRSKQPYFVLQGNVCALLAAKDHVNVFLYDGGIVPDPDGIITAGHDNKTARTVAIRRGEAVNAPALSAMFRHIIANNRAGGWRKLKRERLLETGAAKESPLSAAASVPVSDVRGVASLVAARVRLDERPGA
jgi:hypothetical protein